MSTTQQTGYQFAPSGMANYNAFQNALQGPILGYATNPFGNQFYQQNVAQNMGAANRQSQNVISGALANFNQTGFGGAPSGALTQLMAGLGRYGSGMNANAFYNAANNAFANQWKALGTMSSFSPLQTGSTQTTGGTGSWLPQIVAAALGGASAFAQGGGFGGANAPAMTSFPGVNQVAGSNPLMTTSSFPGMPLQQGAGPTTGPGMGGPTLNPLVF
jgi:hypothetical protein